MRSLPILLLATMPCLAVYAGAPSPERQQALTELLHEDCGACHGMRLTGGLGPALTPRALAGKPRALLVASIRDGRAGTPMPPWKNLLGEQDIAWLVDYLMQAER